MSSEQMLPLAAQNNNIIRLAVAQALAGANSVVFYATGAIVGNTIAPSPSLAILVWCRIELVCDSAFRRAGA